MQSDTWVHISRLKIRQPASTNPTQHEVGDEGRASNDPPLPTRERPLQRLAKSHPGENGMIDGTDNEMIKILESQQMEKRK